MDSLPVIWREDGGPEQVGRLDLLPDRLVLDGGSARIDVHAEIPRSEVKARRASIDERLHGKPTVLLEQPGKPLLRVAPLLNGLGMILEHLGRQTAR